MRPSEFLTLVFSGQPEGWICLAALDLIKGPDGKRPMTQKWFSVRDLSGTDAWVELNKDYADIYYCANIFTEKSRRSELASPLQPALFSDLDTCDPDKLLIKPSLVVESSPGRWQGLWILETPVAPAVIEQTNKSIARNHKADGADQSGWDLTQLLRMPGTPNHKYNDKPTVTLVSADGPASPITAFHEAYPPVEVEVRRKQAVDLVFEELPTDSYQVGTLNKIYEECASKGKNSDQVWHLMNRCAEIGLTPGQIWTALHSYEPALAKDAENPSWLEGDFQRFMDKKWEEKQAVQIRLPKAVTQTANRRIRLTPATDFKLQRVKWGWQDRMPIGELTLIPGREGIGKSLFMAWLTAQITKGTLEGEFYGQKRKVFYAANEDAWEYTIGPRMAVAGADMSMVYRIDVVDDGRLILPMDTHLIADVAKAENAAALFLDPMISLVDDNLNINQTRDMRRALEPVRKAAEDAGIVIAALVHFNKATETDILTKIPGSRAFAEVCRAAIAIGKDEIAGHQVVSQVKNNLGRLDLPNLTYEIEGVELEVSDGITNVGLLRWTGESDVSVQEVMERKPEKKQPESTTLGNATTSYRVLQVVIEANRVVSLNEVYDEVPDIEPATVRQALSRLASKAKIKKVAHGQYAPVDLGVVTAEL